MEVGPFFRTQRVCGRHKSRQKSLTWPQQRSSKDYYMTSVAKFVKRVLPDLNRNLYNIQEGF